MTRFSESDLSGNLGVAAVKFAVLKNLRWAFREQPLPDFGIDGQIETADTGGKATGRLIGCQIKAGPSYFNEKTPSGIIYRGDPEHLAYWLGHSLPVIVILHDQETNICYWQAVTNQSVEKTGKGWKIEIPFTQQLNTDAQIILERLADTGWLESARTFTTPERFFKRFKDNPFFDFSQTLRGRESYLNELSDFLHDENLEVAVLSGRGGIGKSKLVHDWTKQLSGWTILFKKERTSLHAQSELELHGDKILVIADDAHRQNDLQELLQLIRDQREEGTNIKCLLSTRPVGMFRVDSALSRSFESKSIIRLKELRQLGPKEVRELAVEVLGAAHARLVPFLAEVSADTPLITVIGGRLLAQGAVEGTQLPNHDDFRRMVFDRILDDLETVVHLSERNPRPLLHLISALQPVALRNANTLTHIASFVGWKEYEVAQAVDHLETCGLISRSANLYRLAPDMFADFLLEQATVNALGESTKYADELFRVFNNDYFSNLLLNLAELDFRAISRGQHSILEGIWEEIEQFFKSGSVSDRIFILNKIGNTAFFQPAPVMKLVRIAMDNPEEPNNATVKTVTLDPGIVNPLARILHALAYQKSFREEALRRLWALAKQEIPDSLHGESAAKTLKSLASYSMYKAVEINLAVASLAASISDAPDAFDGTLSPLDIVDVLMEREGEENESVGMTIVMSSFGLNHPVVKPVREICFCVVEKHLASTNIRIACRAFKSIEPLIRGFLTKFGRTRSETELKWQAEERERSLLILKKRLEAGNVPLILARQIKATLEPLFNRTQNENTQINIGHVLAALPDTPMLEIFDAFCTGQWEYRGGIGTVEDIQAETQKNREFSIKSAQRLGSIYPTIAERINVLNDFFAQASQCEIKTPGANDFVSHLCRDKCFLLEIAALIMADALPQQLLPVVPVVFVALRDHDAEEYLRVGKVAAGSHNPNILSGISRAVDAAVFSAAIEADRVILEMLYQRNEGSIQYTVVQALGRLGSYPRFRNYAAKSLLNLKVKDNSIADVVCEAFTNNIELENLSSEEFGALLRLFVELPRLNEYGQGYHIKRVLQWGIQNRPDKFLDFLLLRVEEGEKRRNRKEWSYTIIPETSNNFMPETGNNLMLAELGGSPNLPSFLRKVISYVENGSCIADELSALFWKIVTPSETAFELVRPLLGRDTKSCEAAIRMVSLGPRGMALDYPLFVVECLEAANQFGSSVLDRTLMQFTLNSFPLKTSGNLLDSPPANPLLTRLYEQITQRAEEANMRPDFHFEEEESEF